MSTGSSDAPRPRLLTLTPDFPPSVGGIQLLLGRLLEHLPGWEHLVISRAHDGAPSPVRAVRTRMPAGPASIVELNTLAVARGRAFHPDVVLNGHVITTPGALLAARGRTPVVTYAYADELTHRPAVTRLAVRRSAATIAISRYTSNLVRGAGSRGPVHLVVPGFDARRSTPTPDDRPTILTVARLADRYKGHDVVLRAMPAILRAVPDARWIVAGDGPLRAELEDLARRLGVAEHVTFLGLVTDAERRELLNRAWVFTMPSRLPFRGAGGEGFGIVYLEAAAAGVPVVAGRAAGALDAVDDGRTGLLVDPTSPAEVADGLVRVLTDDRLRNALARAGPGWAAAFTWQRMADDVDAVLRREMRSSTAGMRPGRADGRG